MYYYYDYTSFLGTIKNEDVDDDDDDDGDNIVIRDIQNSFMAGHRQYYYYVFLITALC